MSLSAFSYASLNNQKRAKSMFLHPRPEVEIDTSLIKQIGNYKLGEEIGSGAFGKVILGLHIITGEKVAIKILDKFILSQTPEDYELVKQELSILKIVKHKYIVQLYEILETPQHIFIIMEYCEGQDIMDYILTRNRLTEEESLKYFQQLINALYYLHSQNITHRDIKIDNLLLDRNLDLKLIDFGLSTKYRDDKLLNQPCGTVVYAAPEVLDCREYHGMLADVWSSGIVLFGMLSGFLPFGDPDDEINKRLVLQGKIEMPKFFSRQATDLLRHMLDINPLTRYTLEDIMEHPWFNKKKFRLIPGITIGINKIPIDEKIVNLCVTYNMDKNKVRDSVINNKFNNESTLYYLLVKKLKACGNDSVSDLCSNKFIKYIFDDNNRIYLNEIQNIVEINIQKDTKETNKEKEKDRKKCYSQLNDNILNLDKKDQIYNYNNKENDTDLSAAPGLINDNFSKKDNNSNLINIENNTNSIYNSRNFDDSDIINMNEKENSSNNDINDSRLRVNLGETEFNKKEFDNEDYYDYFEEKTIPATHRIYTKGKLDPTMVEFLSKNDNNNKKNINTNRISRLAGKNKNKFNKSANNKKEKRYINDKGNKKEKINKNFKLNFIKKIINKNNKEKQPLTSRNEYNTIESNSYIYSTQITNSKKNKRKIIPIKKDFYKNIKTKNNKDNNTLKLNFKIKKIQDKKDLLAKNSINKTIIQSKKIINPLKNIPPLNINNKTNKISLKKLPNKRKHLNTNILDNTNEIYNKLTSNHNKSIDSRNKLNTQRNNNEITSYLFKTIYKKNNNNSLIINNNEKNKDKNNQKNSNQLFKNKINSKSIENRQKFIIDYSNSKDKKINKSNVVNLLDNFNLFQKRKKNMNSNIINKNNNKILNKSNIIKTSVATNNNSKYKNKYKKDFSYVQSALLTFDKKRFQDDQNKTNGFNTDRTGNIYNLKKQSCFDKENNINNSNNAKNNSKNNIPNNNNNNNNNKSYIPINQKDKNLLKIKDYYLKRKKIENLNIKDFNNISYTIAGNKINNSLAQTTLNTNNSNTNNQLTNKNNIASNTISSEKCNTSRINVTLKNKSIKERKTNNLHKKMNTSILSSINKIKEYKKQKTKLINPKKIFDNNNNSKINSLLKIDHAPNSKLKTNNSLSKNKNDKNSINNINKNKAIKKTHHLESSVVVYRQKSPFKIRDLSDSPKQKYLNEKTRNNRIPWKIKKKGIDEKLDGLSIYNRYMNQFQNKNNNPFKKRNLLKKKYNNKKDKNSSFLIKSKIKSNRHSLIPSSSNQKTLNISFSNYNNNNDNTNNQNQKFKMNETSHEFYKHKKNKNNLNINNNINNIEDNKKKELNIFKYKQIKNNMNKLNLHKRNDRTLNINYNYEFNLTQNINNELQMQKLNDSIKKKFNKSISFGSLQSLDGAEKNNMNDLEEPFDLSCLFISNKKINENNFGNKLKKLGMNCYQKNNIINCSKNGFSCQILINIFKNNSLLENKRNNIRNNLICYKIFDMKNRINIIKEILSKLSIINK